MTLKSNANYSTGICYLLSEVLIFFDKLNTDKTELIWTGSRHNLSLLGGCGPSLQLGDDVIKPINHVQLFGVTIAANLDKHACFECLQEIFLLASAAETCSSLAGH